MIRSYAVLRLVAWNTFLLVSALSFAPDSWAHEMDQQHVHFQKPHLQRTQGAAQNERLKFRSSSSRAVKKSQAEKTSRGDSAVRTTYKQTAHDNSLRRKPLPKQSAAATKTKSRQRRARSKSLSSQKQAEVKQIANSQIASAEYRSRKVQRDDQVLPVAHGRVVFDSQLQQACAFCGAQGGCACEPGCGLGEPGCGIVDTGCGCPEPACGLAGSCDCADPGCGLPSFRFAERRFSEPGCGVGGACDCGEPTCGICEPTCGVVDGCGSCVGRPGPDYWCFPVCLPRFKELTFWGGVHGFRGPRDFSIAPGGQVGRSDSNFGFQEGVNIGGRAPLFGLFFPQISYQLGYQAVQSRLSGTTSSTDDRSQQFVTAALFRRVSRGLQFGVAWDLMEDDLDINADFHQIRTEISLKSPLGREIGFWSATHVNDTEIGGITYQSVDQYLLFYRWHFRNGGEGRLWGGGTDDNEGLFGGEFEVPLNDRWSLQSGFNYLITDQDEGPSGVSEESWNVGMNLVWHYGCTARQARNNPFRPLFNVANNGLMFIDAKP